jgi:hypothetical protein
VVILGGIGFKLPQILKIAKNKSVEGIALSQYMLELLISANTLSFNYHIDAPFSTYGESFFILLQNVVIVFQIAFYRSMSPASFIGGWAVYLLILAFLYSEFSRDLKLDAPMCTFTGGVSCKIAPAAFQDILQVRAHASVYDSTRGSISDSASLRPVAVHHSPGSEHVVRHREPAPSGSPPHDPLPVQQPSLSSSLPIQESQSSEPGLPLSILRSIGNTSSGGSCRPETRLE